MAVRAKVDWNGEKVLLAAVKALDLEAIAFQVEAHAKQNIVDNDQVDTGFMLNSTYTIIETEGGFESTRNTIFPDGEYHSPKTDQMVQRSAAPQPPLPNGYSAAVVVGADYAIYQENQISFLYQALDQTAKDIEGLVGKL